MIIRPAGSAQLLIAQPDHAALAAHVMRHWRHDGFPEAERQASILLAIQEHDNGWREVDAAPIVDSAGCILDFVSAPDHVRRGVWPRGVKRLEAAPHAAALVAQHAIHVYRRYRGDPDWAPFFTELEGIRDRHLEVASVARDDLLREYFYLRIGDLLSLTFCNGWIETQRDESGYAVRLDGDRLLITPDPFEGREIAIEITARELPLQPYSSASDAAAAYTRAPEVLVKGVVHGDS